MGGRGSSFEQKINRKLLKLDDNRERITKDLQRHSKMKRANLELL
jgi:hypothetical protein